MSKSEMVVIVRQRKKRGQRLFGVKRFNMQLSDKDLLALKKADFSVNDWETTKTEIRAWYIVENLFSKDKKGVVDRVHYIKGDNDFVSINTDDSDQIREVVNQMDNDQRFFLQVMDQTMGSLYRGFTIFSILNLMFGVSKDNLQEKNLYSSEHADRICLDGNIGKIDTNQVSGKSPTSVSSMYKNGWTTDEVMKFLLINPFAVFTNFNKSDDNHETSENQTQT